MADVQGVMVTHIHPDHYGLAGRVRETSGAWIALHPADAALDPRPLRGAHRPARAHGRRCCASSARRPSELEELRNASMPARPFVDFVEPDVLMEDGDKPDMPGLGRHRAVDARPLPRPPLLLGGDATA